MRGGVSSSSLLIPAVASPRVTVKISCTYDMALARIVSCVLSPRPFASPASKIPPPPHAQRFPSSSSGLYRERVCKCESASDLECERAGSEYEYKERIITYKSERTERVRESGDQRFHGRLMTLTVDMKWYVRINHI